MPFYQDKVSIIVPGRVDDYGDSDGYTWDEARGAVVREVEFMVDFQPVTTPTDGTGAVTISSYRLHTPPGRGFDFHPSYRLAHQGRQYVLSGELGVFTSARHASGIDHVEADFKRYGASDGER